MLGDDAAGAARQLLPYLFIFPLLFLLNFGILFGPLVFFGIKQMKGYEPGDADWGVRLDDVRGQAEPKEDVTRVISLWQAGEEFRAAGGKPERGLLFIGAPGTGKTMLSKAIATSFNSPIMTMPGSGFASTFMGMDVVIVLILIGRARRLARKWGGQCIIFIDEIDAVGLRRQALGAGGFAGRDDAVAVAGQRLVPRLRLPRADGRADLQRRPRARDARLAREAVRRAGDAGARPAAAVLARPDRRSSRAS